MSFDLPEEVFEEVTTHSVFIIREDDTIYQYSLQDYKRPELLKTLPTYEYVFIHPAFYSVSDETGNLYIITKDVIEDGTTTLFVLAYRPHEPTIRTLYRAIDTGIPFADAEKFAPTIAAAGKSGVDFVYVSFNGQETILRIPREPLARVTIGDDLFPIDTYTKAYDFPFAVISHDGDTYDQIVYHIIYVNKQFTVTIHQEVIKEELGGDPFKTTGNHTTWEFNPVNWYSGPVVGFSIECQDCVGGPSGNDTISIVNRVEWEKNQSKYDSLSKMQGGIQGSYYDEMEQRMFFINRDNLSVYDLDMQLVGKPHAINLPSDNTVCKLLTPCFVQPEPIQDRVLQYLLAICEEDDSSIQVQPFSYVSDTQLDPLDIFYLPQIKDPQDAQCIDGKLLVLDRGGFPHPEIMVYNFALTIEQKLKNADPMKLFTDYYPPVGEPLVISAFQVARTPFNEFSKLFIVNETRSVVVVTVKTDSYDIVEEDEYWEVEVINVVQLLQNENQFIRPQTLLLNLRVIAEETFDPDEVTQDDLFLYRTILITNETAVYELAWEFNYTKISGEHYLLLADVEPQYTYAPYGDGIALPWVSTLDYYFAVCFINSDDGFEAAPVTYTIVVYYSQVGLSQEERALTLRQSRQLGYEPLFIKYIGGHDFNKTPLIDYFLRSHFLLYNRKQRSIGGDDGYGLYAPHPDFFTEKPHNIFTLYHKYIRVLCTDEFIQYQEIEFIPRTRFEIEGLPKIAGHLAASNWTPDVPPEPENKHLVAIIVPSVIGGVVLLGIAGFFLWKYYKKRQAVEKETSEGGFSMQEPLRA